MTDRHLAAAPKGTLAAAMRRLVGKQEEAPAAASTEKQPAGPGSLSARMRSMIGEGRTDG